MYALVCCLKLTLHSSVSLGWKTQSNWNNRHDFACRQYWFLVATANIRWHIKSVTKALHMWKVAFKTKCHSPRVPKKRWHNADWSSLYFTVQPLISFVVCVCVCERERQTTIAAELIQYELWCARPDKCSAVPWCSHHLSVCLSKHLKQQMTTHTSSCPVANPLLLFVCGHVHTFADTCQLCHCYKTSNRPHKRIC